MGYRLTKATLGQKDNGVILAKSTVYPQCGTAVAGTGGVGTETAPVVAGASQTCDVKVSFSNPSGASSVWNIPAPQGRWRVVDVLVRKTGAGTGGAADVITVKSIKSGTTSGGLFGSAAGGTTLVLNTIAAGTLVRPAQRNDTSDICLLDSSRGDVLEVTVAKGTTTAQCDITFSFVLEA